MKRLISLTVVTGALAVAACASQVPRSSSGPDASHDVAASTAQKKAATPQKDKLGVPYGYRRVVMNGLERFCRTDTVTGSRTQKEEVCLTREELQAQQDSSRDFMNNLSRQSGEYTGTGASLPGP